MQKNYRKNINIFSLYIKLIEVSNFINDHHKQIHQETLKTTMQMIKINQMMLKLKSEKNINKSKINKFKKIFVKFLRCLLFLLDKTNLIINKYNQENVCSQ